MIYTFIDRISKEASLDRFLKRNALRSSSCSFWLNRPLRFGADIFKFKYHLNLFIINFSDISTYKMSRLENLKGD